MVITYFSITSNISVIIAFWSTIEIIFTVALKKTSDFWYQYFCWKQTTNFYVKISSHFPWVCFRYEWNYLLCTRVQSGVKVICSEKYVNCLFFHIYFLPGPVTTDASKNKTIWRNVSGGLSIHSLIEHFSPKDSLNCINIWVFLYVISYLKALRKNHILRIVLLTFS